MFSGDRALWEGYVSFFFLFTRAKPAHLTFASLKGNAWRAHLGPTGKRKPTGPRQKTLQRREALVGSSASYSEIPRFTNAISNLAPARRWNQAQHTADLQRVSLLYSGNFLFVNRWFTGIAYCEEISLPDEGNKGKDCSGKGERDIGPGAGMYRWILVIFNTLTGTRRCQLKTRGHGFIPIYVFKMGGRSWARSSMYPFCLQKNDIILKFRRASNTPGCKDVWSVSHVSVCLIYDSFFHADRLS